MAEILELIKTNLINTGWALLIFVGSYLANMGFSILLNLGYYNESWDWNKFLRSIIKVGVFLVCTSLLVASITALPVFAELIHWEIPDEFKEIFSGLAIIVPVLTLTLRYAKEAKDKAIEILDFNGN